MVRTHSGQRKSIAGARRLLASAALLVFVGAFFVLPLYGALALCSMPCCHPENDNGGGSLVSAAMAACVAECSIRADEPRSSAKLSVVSPAPDRGLSTGTTAIVAVADAQLTGSVFEHRPTHPTVGADAQLHLLNSTFRI